MSNSTLIADEYKDAKKAYEMGKNDEALSLLVTKLRKDNDHKDAVALFKIVLPLVIDKYLKAAQDYEVRKDWDGAYSEYEVLLRINEMISSITPLEETKINSKKIKKPIEMPKIDVRAQRENVINNAAEDHYQKGVTYMQNIGYSSRAVEEFDAANKYILNYKNSHELSAEALYCDGAYMLEKKDYKNAFKKFRGCGTYIPGYKDSEILAEKAKQAAIRRIVIMPFDNLSGKTQFGEVAKILTDRIISIAIQSQPEFLEFVPREYIHQISQELQLINESTATKVGQIAGVHDFVFGKILTIAISYPPDEEMSGENTYKLTDRTVGAKWIKHTRYGYVEVNCSYQIIDVEKGAILISNNITKRAEDRAQWVTYYGSEEGIQYVKTYNPEVKNHHTTGERALESPEILTNKAIESIASGLADYIIRFFK